MRTAVRIWLTMLLALGAVWSVSGCGGEAETATPSTTPGPAGTATGPADYAENWSPDGLLGDDEYPNRLEFGAYEVRWFSHEDTAYFGLGVETDGWAAIGFQPGTAMLNADMVLGYVQNGEATVIDQFSTGRFGPHSPDTELGGTDDILESGGGMEDGLTIIEFSRRADTGDEYDIPLVQGENQIIWAYGTTDDTGRQHVVRGYGTIVP